MQEVIIDILEILFFPGILFLILYAFLLEWLDRKVYARIQSRVGPLITGPKGILQPVADFIKLLSKEDITPDTADRFGFTITPLIALFVALLSLFFIPVVSYEGLISFPGDLLFVIFISTVFNIMIILAGYFATSGFSTVGAARAGLQFVGYEIPFVISIIPVMLIARSVTIAEIVKYQISLTAPMLFYVPIAFIIFLIAGLAKLERVPFDIPDAETEIASGWRVEYSGKKLAILKLASDLKILFVSSLAATLFLGGPIGPMLLPDPINSFIMFFVKTIVISFILSYLRGIFARYRIDQMLRGFWYVLLPLALIQLGLAVLYVYSPEIFTFWG